MSCHGAGRWARTAKYSGCSGKVNVSVQDPRVIDFFSEWWLILCAQGEIREHLTLRFSCGCDRRQTWRMRATNHLIFG